MTQRRIRIGIACHPTLGGSSMVATRLAHALATRGHHVYVISHGEPAQLEPHDNLTFYPAKAFEYAAFGQVPCALALSSAMVTLSQTHSLDVLHAHYAVPHAVSATLACDVLGAAAPKLVTTLHGTDVTLVGSDPSYLPVTRHAIAKSDAVTAPSEFLRNEARRLFELPELPIEVFANFVDSDSFCPRESTPDAAEVLGPIFGGGHALTVVHVSNFRPLKRINDALKALARLEAVAGPNPVPVRLLMVGDGPDRAAAERLAVSLGIADRVRFIGAHHDVAPLLAASDLFILPSDNESFGLAALEAMSAGIPVIASNIGGIPEVVSHGETGLLVPVGDIDGFTAALSSLTHDADRRRAMGRAARQRAVNTFALEPAVDRYETLYHRLLA